MRKELIPIENNTKYYATENGDIYNIETKNYLSKCINMDGRYIVCLTFNGISKIYPVHKLVYLAFYKNIENDMTINHINENKLDNTYTNLELLSREDNIRSYLFNHNDPFCKKYPDDLIVKICEDLSNGIHYRELAIKYDIPINYLYSIVKK